MVENDARIRVGHQLGDQTFTRHAPRLGVERDQRVAIPVGDRTQAPAGGQRDRRRWQRDAVMLAHFADAPESEPFVQAAAGRGGVQQHAALIEAVEQRGHQAMADTPALARRRDDDQPERCLPLAPQPAQACRDHLAVALGDQTLAVAQYQFPIGLAVRPEQFRRQRVRRIEVARAHRPQADAVRHRRVVRANHLITPVH